MLRGKPLMTRHCMLVINARKADLVLLDIKTKLSKPKLNKNNPQ